MFVPPEIEEKIKQSIDIVNVISEFVDLKKQGNIYVGFSPVHDEKTPSFNVVPHKNLFKDFSSGIGGDAIKFLMEIQGMTYPEALQWLAKHYSIEIPEKKLSAADKEKYQEKEALLLVNDFARKAFEYNLHKTNEGKVALDYLTKARKLKVETIEAFEVGFALNSWNNLVDFAKRGNYSPKYLTQAGLIKAKKEKKQYYDFFRNRVMFPIKSATGRVCAFSGRTLGDDKAKYLNSPENPVFNKSKELFGFFQAKPEIRKTETVHLVEGQIDVLQMHQHGYKNTVAVSGTAISEHQIKMISNVAKKAILIFDNDKAGQRVTKNASKALIAAGIQVSISEMPDGEDPDGLLTKSPDEFKKVLSNKQDAIVFLANQEIKSASSPVEKANAVKHIAELVKLVKDKTTQEIYVKTLATTCKLQRKVLAQEVGLAKKENDKKEEIILEGLNFVEKNNQFFKRIEKDGVVLLEKLTNFKIKFLYQVRGVMNGDKKAMRLVQLKNEWGQEVISSIPVETFNDATGLMSHVEKEGNFFFFETSRAFLQAMKHKGMVGVPQAKMITNLGLQANKSYAFANGIIADNKLLPFNDFGICEQKIRLTQEMVAKLRFDDTISYGAKRGIFGKLKPSETELKNTYLSEFSFFDLANRKSGITLEEEDEDMLRFKFKKSNISFPEWVSLLQKSYPEHYIWIVSYLVASLFWDIIYKENRRWFPNLFFFGQPKSGKSAAAESLVRPFGGVLNPFHLGSKSTSANLQRTVSRLRNAIVYFEEYSNAIPDFLIQMLKGLADGTGRGTGVKSNDNRTNQIKPYNGTVITGQQLPTKDPALLERCIVREFDEKKRGNFEDFKKLQRIENQGLGHLILEVLKHRELIADKYEEKSAEIYGVLKDTLKHDDERLYKNFYTLIAPLLILEENGFDIGISTETLFTETEKVMREQMELQAVAGDVEQYFEVINNLIATGQIPQEMFDIGIEQNKKVLYLRTRQVHLNYQRAMAQVNGVGLRVREMQGYLQKHKAFVSQKKNHRFHGGNPTSCFCFDVIYLREIMGLDFNVFFQEISLNKENVEGHVNSFMQNLKQGYYKLPTLYQSFMKGRNPEDGFNFQEYNFFQFAVKWSNAQPNCQYDSAQEQIFINF